MSKRRRRQAVNLRLAAPALEALDRLSGHLRLTHTHVIELLLGQAERGEIPAPDGGFTTWHDNAGTTLPFSRRLSDAGVDSLHRLSTQWGLSQGDTIEFLVWWRARTEGLIR